MSSSIYNEHTAWHVSNMMFARVLEFAGDVGNEMASTEQERLWVQDLAAKAANFGTYSPDIDVRDLFANAEQIEFWRAVLSELALRIFKRRIGNQSDESWQVRTIWAAVDLARVLDSSAQLIRSSAG